MAGSGDKHSPATVPVSFQSSFFTCCKMPITCCTTAIYISVTHNGEKLNLSLLDINMDVRNSFNNHRIKF